MEMRCQNAPGFSDLPNVTEKALAGRLPPKIHVPSSNRPFLLLTFGDSSAEWKSEAFKGQFKKITCLFNFLTI